MIHSLALALIPLVAPLQDATQQEGASIPTFALEELRVWETRSKVA